jgi:hypothetical protein
MSDENKPTDQEDDSSGLLKIWNSIDIVIRRILVGAVILLALYYLASPYQNCMRDVGRSGACLNLTAW